MALAATRWRYASRARPCSITVGPIPPTNGGSRPTRYSTSPRCAKCSRPLLAQAVRNRELRLDNPVAKYVTELEQASDIGRERYLHVQLGCASDVAARPTKAGDEAKPDRVAARFEYDRNGRSRRFCRKRRLSSSRDNYCHLTLNQIGRQCGQLFAFIPGEAIFHRDVLTLDKTCVFQTLMGRSQEARGVAGRPAGEEPDHRIAGCCARTASGQAAPAPPSVARNFRRSM
jgi:hypothetical protein